MQNHENSAAEYSQIAPGVTAEDFLSGRTGLVMGFPGTNQTVVDLWSEGFQLTGPLDAPNELGRYCQARDQLAKHLWRAILAEYARFGGAPAACAWYDNALRGRREAIIHLAARAVALRHGQLTEPDTGFVPMDRERRRQEGPCDLRKPSCYARHQRLHLRRHRRCRNGGGQVRA